MSFFDETSLAKAKDILARYPRPKSAILPLAHLAQDQIGWLSPEAMEHIAELTEVTLISGGNDETDGNVQLVRRREGYSLDGHLVEIHPEIGLAVQSDVMPGTGCAALAAERPQLVVTNLMVASAMLNCLWAVTEQGSVPYSEVYLDVVHNAARSRSWFRVPAATP